MREGIYADVNAERIRQDEKHPNLPKYILHPITDPNQKQFELSKRYQQEINDKMELSGDHSWCGIMNEEDAEVFSAETIEELDTELVQSIALRVRMLEQVRAGFVTIKKRLTAEESKKRIEKEQTDAIDELSKAYADFFGITRFVNWLVRKANKQ